MQHTQKIATQHFYDLPVIRKDLSGNITLKKQSFGNVRNFI
jgi:hypothetical protein